LFSIVKVTQGPHDSEICDCAWDVLNHCKFVNVGRSLKSLPRTIFLVRVCTVG